MSTFSRNKEANAERAAELYKENEKRFLKDILNLVDMSKIYDNSSNLSNVLTSKVNSDCILCDSDTVNAAFEYATGRTCILNFASYKNPGGGFLKGSMAQEESLCHSSVLYNGLSRLGTTFYEKNCSDMNRALYRNRAVYSPDVIFMRDNTVKSFDVLTCAAPNFSVASKYNNVSINENDEALNSRIKFILDIMSDRRCDTVILGAFGCGVFGQDAYKVAKMFLQNGALNRRFTKVIFAIPDKNGRNYKGFERVFGNKYVK